MVRYLCCLTLVSAVACGGAGPETAVSSATGSEVVPSTQPPPAAQLQSVAAAGAAEAEEKAASAMKGDSNRVRAMQPAGAQAASAGQAASSGEAAADARSGGGAGGAGGAGGTARAEPAGVDAPSAGGTARAEPAGADAPSAGEAASAEQASGAQQAPGEASIAAAAAGTDIADCYTVLSSEHPATIEFRRAFHAGDYAARKSAIEGLAAAASSYPNEEEFALLHGLANLWLAGERQDLDDSLSALSATQTVITELKRAYQLCPTDHRIPGWLGSSMIILGQLELDDAKVREGEKVLEQGMQHYPLFMRFSSLIVSMGLDQKDPKFVQALETARYFLEDSPRECEASPDSVCFNSVDVPHNLQGMGLYTGDVFARAQDRERALRAYNTAKQSADWDTWKYQSVIEERIETLDQRMQAAQNDTELDDLESASASTTQCQYCHGN